MHHLIHFSKYHLPAIGWLMFILIGTSLPGHHLPKTELLLYDKFVHFGIYMVLSICLWWSFRHYRSKRVQTFAPLLAILVCVGWGGIDEWHQMLIPTRHADVYDWLADSMGGVMGQVIVFVVGKFFLLLRNFWQQKSTVA